MPIAPKLPRAYYPRQVPTDSFFTASEAELASLNFDALRSNALKLAPTPAASTELHRMWIPCPTVIRKKHLADLLDELATDSQPQVWKDARQTRLLQDFFTIPNAGVRFTCASYDMASKLSQVSLTASRSTIRIARFSKYGSRYYVDLVRVPDEYQIKPYSTGLNLVDLPAAPLHSSLRQSLQASQLAMKGQQSDTDDAMSTSDDPPIYVDSDDDSLQDQVGLRDNSGPMDETIIAPVPTYSAPVWAKAARNRRALSAIDNPNSVDIVSMEYEVKDLDCPTQAKKVKMMLFVWRAPPPYKGDSTYTAMVTPLTINYEVESMTRGELFDYVDSFLGKFESRPPLDQLATIEAIPGLMLGAIAT
ncbi:hypothetical protein Plhal703r1_c01g0000061 [Plasmopara halstedii]